MKQILLVSLIVSFTLCIYGCKLDNEEPYLMYKNNTSDTIVMFSSNLIDSTSRVSSYAYGCAEIFPNTIGASPTPVYLVDEYMIFYVVKNSLHSYWFVLNSKKEPFNIMVRYELNKEDILQLDYTIPYPPSPMMKDMKMYPTYEEVIKQDE